jgi:hypothetical protein
VITISWDDEFDDEDMNMFEEAKQAQANDNDTEDPESSGIVEAGLKDIEESYIYEGKPFTVDRPIIEVHNVYFGKGVKQVSLKKKKPDKIEDKTDVDDENFKVTNRFGFYLSERGTPDEEKLPICKSVEIKKDLVPYGMTVNIFYAAVEMFHREERLTVGVYTQGQANYISAQAAEQAAYLKQLGITIFPFVTAQDVLDVLPRSLIPSSPIRSLETLVTSDGYEMKEGIDYNYRAPCGYNIVIFRDEKDKIKNKIRVALYNYIELTDEGIAKGTEFDSVYETSFRFTNFGRLIEAVHKDPKTDTRVLRTYKYGRKDGE